MKTDTFLLCNTKLGRYQVVETIGHGRSATVYRGNDPELGRPVALKVLPAYYMDDPSFVDRFRHEAQTAARLNHPNILKVHDFGEDRGFAFIVTELVGGGTLQDRMGSQLELSEVLRFTVPLSRALDYAHAQGVVHRDVKPSNVLMDVDGKPVLSDFGVARMLESSIRHTQPGSIVGTPEYISPEVALGKPADHRSDIYAFGVVVYQMLFVESPYLAETPTGTIFAHINEPLSFPSTAGGVLAPRVEGVLRTALAKDPDDRYQAAGELVTALRALSRETVEGPHGNPEDIMGSTPVSKESLDVLSNGVARVAAAPARSDASEGAVSVFLVEDHRLVLEALQSIVDADDRLKVKGGAQTAEEAMAKLEAAPCDVVIMDITLPGINGIEATRQIKRRFPETRVLILSGYGELYLSEAIAAGADGYLMKTASGDEVRDAINEILSGRSPVDRSLTRSLFKMVADTSTADRPDAAHS